MQLLKSYETTPEMPVDITEPYHPRPTLLNLEWSHEGEWDKIPVSREDKGPTYENYRLGRIERYIDLSGKIRKALSYGEEESKLKVWFSLEDMLSTYPHTFAKIFYCSMTSMRQIYHPILPHLTLMDAQSYYLTVL